MSIDDLLNVYGAYLPLIWAQLLPYARGLFYVLAAVEMTWSLLEWSATEGGSLWGKVLARVVTLAFFFSLLTAYPTLSRGLVGGLMEVPEQALGISFVGPSELVGQGMVVAVGVILSIDFLSFLEPLTLLFRVVPGMVVLVAFILIAWQMLRALLEYYVVIGMGIFFFAFAASRWSFSMAEGLMRYAMTVGVRRFVLIVLIAIGRDLPREWILALEQGNFFTDFATYAHVIASATIFALMIWTVPEKVASAVGGSLNLGNPYRG